MTLPYNFPDPLEESRRRSEEFQRLTVPERLAEILDTFLAGMYLRDVSPHKELIDRMFLEKEVIAQDIQRELIRRHG
jgi:hypothetical protein